MTPNRIVAVLTPLVFAPAAGAVAAWVAKHAPGVDLSTEELTNIFIAGALVAIAPALQWLHGWQKYEERQAQTESAVEVATAAAAAGALALPAAAPDETEPEGETDFDELDALEAAGEDEDDEDPLIAGEPAAIALGG
jgi:cytochrome bd-type quinol oxidase subunit 2